MSLQRLSGGGELLRERICVGPLFLLLFFLEREDVVRRISLPSVSKKSRCGHSFCCLLHMIGGFPIPSVLLLIIS